MHITSFLKELLFDLLFQWNTIVIKRKGFTYTLKCFLFKIGCKLRKQTVKYMDVLSANGQTFYLRILDFPWCTKQQWKFKVQHSPLLISPRLFLHDAPQMSKSLLIPPLLLLPPPLLLQIKPSHLGNEQPRKVHKNKNSSQTPTNLTPTGLHVLLIQTGRESDPCKYREWDDISLSTSLLCQIIWNPMQPKCSH